MAAHEHAQALYDEVAEQQEGTVDAFKTRLIERAQEVRQGVTDTVRSNVATTLEHASPEERVQMADELDRAAEGIDQALGGSSLTLKKLDENVAGEAQLGADVICIDPRKITGGDGIVDAGMAKDILAHEKEHTRQSAQADAQQVMIRGESFSARALREGGAIREQERIDFLSDEYRSIAARLLVDSEDQVLIRAGRFRDLEAKKNGQMPVALAA
ncbi:MAG: hypothetical protein PHX87_02475 [Candidatus Peribacteraceae bacterium]|nr:hypothetical protein [Candidatus Peribacteraceae bacterium]MDD5742273.1 hypothetical protein [Candidatus Peribacteraceae bacterium]